MGAVIMTESKYRYCKIFVKGSDADTVAETVGRLLRGEFRHRTMRLPGLAVDVLRNPDAARTAGPDDDFVRWPVTIELETDSIEGECAIVETTARILIELWGSERPAVAACEFEDELPWAGGIRRIQVEP